jgi:hypothetical protein
MARWTVVLWLCSIVFACTKAHDHDNFHLLADRCSRGIGMLIEDVKILLHRTDKHEEEEKERVEAVNAPAPAPKPRDCEDVRRAGQTTNGLATIFLPDAASAFFPPRAASVYCDQTTNGGGWLLFLRRVQNHEEAFPTRGWEDYKRGFGNPTISSYFLGLETAYQLTSDRPATLRVELEDFDGETRYAEYSYFRLESETLGYRLFVDGYSGDAGDALSYHNGQRFSTHDQDHDLHPENCAKIFNGAWWYKRCVVSCLTGEYIAGGHHADKPHQGIYWRYWRGENYSYKRAEMKLRFGEL